LATDPKDVFKSLTLRAPSGTFGNLGLKPLRNGKRSGQSADADQGFVVPGVQVVANTIAPTRTELRYFHPSEANEATALAERVTEAGLPTMAVDASKTFEKSIITSRHFEIWFSPGAKIIALRAVPTK
jgi:hypothetical protein